MDAGITLSKEARTLLEEAVDHLEAAYDKTACLISEEYQGHHFPSLRNSMYYVLGLLILGRPDAGETTDAVCRKVLSFQMDAPNEVWHGAFRHPDAPVPPHGLFDWRTVSLSERYRADVTWERIQGSFDRRLREDARFSGQAEQIEAVLHQALLEQVPVAWDTYEPNIREFIGMCIAMLLQHFNGMLSDDLTASLKASARLLMDGAIARSESGFTPLNTNIRIMYVFLLDWFGRYLQEAAWQEKAQTEALRLLSDYRAYHACAEFNSPTYCGVDLATLGFWRRYGSEALKSAGAELEQGIWEDMAAFYNPEMRNFCGPYSRCYELDMRIHTCFYDLLYLGLGEARFPLHPFSIEGVMRPLTVLGDVAIPSGLSEAFTGPCQTRFVTRRFRELSERGDPQNNHALCTASAWITPALMYGVMSGSENPSYQLHPFVLFWRHNDRFGTVSLHRRLPDGTMNHLRTVLFDGTISQNRADLEVRNRTARTVEVFFRLECPGLQPEQLKPEVWLLPGLHVDFSASGPRSRLVRYPDGACELCWLLEPEDALRFHLVPELQEAH